MHDGLGPNPFFGYSGSERFFADTEVGRETNSFTVMEWAHKETCMRVLIYVCIIIWIRIGSSSHPWALIALRIPRKRQCQANHQKLGTQYKGFVIASIRVD